MEHVQYLPTYLLLLSQCSFYPSTYIYPQPAKQWMGWWMKEYIGLSALSDVNSGSSSANGSVVLQAFSIHAHLDHRSKESKVSATLALPCASMPLVPRLSSQRPI